MFKIDINGESFEYRVERKKRKTIGIKITLEGEVIVASPLNVDNEYIKKLVEKKADWIIEKLDSIRESKKDTPSMEFRDGETIPYLGKRHKLRVIGDVWERAGRLSFHGDEFTLYINPKLDGEKRLEAGRMAMEKWMRKEAGRVFKERTKHFGEVLGLYPEKIVIKDQKSVWGSCSSRGNINYNYRLVMAPIEILDYIVVHELCHMKHPNHSKEYWNTVEGILPDYREKRNWLKENGRSLLI